MRNYIIPCLSLLLGLFLFSFQTPQTSNMSDTYKKEWARIDSLEQEGLPKSALQEVEQLYQRAKQEQNHAQVVKTLLYRSKYQSQLEENGMVKVIFRLEEEAASEDFPVQPIMYSILGELYRNYLDANYWKSGFEINPT